MTSIVRQGLLADRGPYKLNYAAHVWLINEDTYLTLAQRNYMTAHTAAQRIQEELDLGDSMFALRLLGNMAAVLRSLDPSASLSEGS